MLNNVNNKMKYYLIDFGESAVKKTNNNAN